MESITPNALFEFGLNRNGTLGPTVPPGQEDSEYLEQLTNNLNTTRFVVQKVLVPTVVILGVVGNVLNMAVLTQRWMKSSTNFYLSALAFFDITYLLCCLYLSLKHYKVVNEAPWYIYTRLPFVRPLTDVCSNSAVWLTVTFTVERYIGVCHPMKGKRWCTPQRAKYMIIIVCFAAAIITFPEFFAWRPVDKVDLVDNQTVSTLEAGYTLFALHPAYSVGYNYVCQALFTFLPLLLLLFFNILLIRAVMRATRRRESLAIVQNDRQERHQREQIKITVMLISVVIVFLFCQLPQASMNVIIATLTQRGELVGSRRIRCVITNNYLNLLVMINSTANFFLYSFFSNKFRRTFHRLFCRCWDSNSTGRRDLLFSDVGTNAMPPTHRRTSYLPTSNQNSPSRVPLNDLGGAQPSHDSGYSSALYPTAPKTRNGYLAVSQEAPDRNGKNGSTKT